jgi:3-oxoacyl-[acyl-carrier-protein] synthase-3
METSVGLSRVAVRLPGWTEPVDDIMVRAERPVTERKMFTKVFGLRNIPSLASGELMEDVLVEAGRAALAGGTASLVLYGHTLLMVETDLCGGFADRLRNRLGLPGCRFYGLSHVNCVSVLRSVEYARRYLARPGVDTEERVLVLGGDQGSVGDDARVIAGTTVSSDCAAGVIVHRGDSSARVRYRYLGGAGARDARFYRNIRMTQEEHALFAKVCSELVVETVERAAAQAGMTLDQVDWVLPHLNNKMFWRTFSIQSGYPRDRICLDLMPETGHSFGVDALMAMEHADRMGRLRPGDRCALIAIGQGAYFQVMIVEVVED